jgi:hypothetical protein
MHPLSSEPEIAGKRDNPEDVVSKLRQVEGFYQTKLAGGGQGVCIVFRDDPEPTIPLLQDQLRDHPLGGDALHWVHAVAAQR